MEDESFGWKWELYASNRFYCVIWLNVHYKALPIVGTSFVTGAVRLRILEIKQNNCPINASETSITSLKGMVSLLSWLQLQTIVP